MYSIISKITMNFKLIIGLGNPKEKYQNTYHNVGTLFLDFLTQKKSSNNTNWEKSSTNKFEFIKTKEMILAKSLEFMNNSGEAVNSALKHFNLKPEEILVVHDDSDIVLGDFKIHYNKNAAGHHGIESLINILGTKNFYRARIGIRPAKNDLPSLIKTKHLKAEKFVLKKINKNNQNILNSIFEKILSKLTEL